jgi:hypothetical protein
MLYSRAISRQSAYLNSIASGRRILKPTALGAAPGYIHSPFQGLNKLLKANFKSPSASFQRKPESSIFHIFWISGHRLPPV